MTEDFSRRPATTGLLADALAQMTSLFEKEIRLVRSEVNEKIGQAVAAVGALVAAAVLLLAALLLILQGIVALLVDYGMRPFLADLLVGLVVAAVGAVAILVARKGLSAESLTPSRSLGRFRQTPRS